MENNKAETTQPAKFGYLEAYTKGIADEHKWVKRYYVLFNESDTAQARLDWYSSESGYLNSPHIRRTIYLEQIEQVAALPDQHHGFEVCVKNQTQSHKFVASSASEMKKWISIFRKIKENVNKQAAIRHQELQARTVDEEEIYEAPVRASSYSVTVIDTEASQRCQLSGPYKIVVSKHHLSLQDISTKNTLFSWPYNFIRRYGRSSTSFTLEAGRKCESGPGVFNFNTKDGTIIFDLVQQMTEAMKKGDTIAAEPAVPPSLPVRNYGNHNAAEDHPDSKAAPETPPLKKNLGRFLGVFSKNHTSAKKENPKPASHDMPENGYEEAVAASQPVPNSVRKSEPDYYLYEPSKPAPQDNVEGDQYFEDDDGGTNSMSELAAAAILQEMASPTDMAYDSLDLSNTRSVHKLKKPSGDKGTKNTEEGHVYCELPMAAPQDDSHLYSEVGK